MSALIEFIFSKAGNIANNTWLSAQGYLSILVLSMYGECQVLLGQTRHYNPCGEKVIIIYPLMFPLCDDHQTSEPRLNMKV